MDTNLLQIIERLRSADEESVITDEYKRIRQQNDLMKQRYGLTTEAGALKENTKKNRYKDILPYDQTRVCLSPTTPELNSDYINANFIKGAAQGRTYIATQGPLSNTVVDFWRMIWQYDVQVIVMACKEIELGKKKCEVYWASTSEPSSFGPFTVSTVAESSPNEEVIVRQLMVNCGDETRPVSQFQYTAWPDHGIPDVPDGILGMMELAHFSQGNHMGPMLIHCSAGCGRTGVICAIDYINDLLAEKKIGDDFSIMDIVVELRRQRPSAVQTKEQYGFVFHTVAQIFEKTLNSNSNDKSNQDKSQDPVSAYSNLVPPKPAVRSISIPGNSCNQKTRKVPPLRPRPSHPPSSDKMNDTYAVVNKSRPPPAHHYDNAGLDASKPPADALYSTVKPKNRSTTNLAQATAPSPSLAHNRVRPVSQWGATATATAPSKSDSGYELLPGEFRPRDSQLYPSLNKVSPSSANRLNSTDDDYEYVSNPIRNSSSNINSPTCSSGSMGFNCRIRKPKGPRDPPPEWNRPER